MILTSLHPIVLSQIFCILCLLKHIVYKTRLESIIESILFSFTCKDVIEVVDLSY